jgi:hypothetical protein
VLRLIVERPRDRELQPELLSNFAGELQDHICEGSAIAAYVTSQPSPDPAEATASASAQ